MVAAFGGFGLCRAFGFESASVCHGLETFVRVTAKRFNHQGDRQAVNQQIIVPQNGEAGRRADR